MTKHPLWLKWRILFIVLPFTLLFALCKIVIYQLGWENWNFDAMASALVAATTFVTAFVLSGILTDYKLSEGLPAEICSCIEAIADCNRMEAKNHPQYNPVPFQLSLSELLEEIYNWLVKRYAIEPVLQKVADLSKWYAILELFTVATVLALLLTHGDRFERDLLLSSALFTAFIYLQLLIRDLDNPFDYNGHSSADVSLGIITITLNRMKQFF